MDYFKLLIENYSSSQTESFFKHLKDLVETKSYKKNDIILNVGQTPSKFYILKKGIVRSYITDNKGREYIKRLYMPVAAFAPLTALLQNKPSSFTFDCLSDCELYEGDFNKLKALIETNLEFALIYIKTLEKIHTVFENKIYDLSVLNATERYKKLKDEIPDIENLITQYHIASYLNITPVQLSRIRKELYSK